MDADADFAAREAARIAAREAAIEAVRRELILTENVKGEISAFMQSFARKIPCMPQKDFDALQRFLEDEYVRRCGRDVLPLEELLIPDACRQDLEGMVPSVVDADGITQKIPATKEHVREVFDFEDFWLKEDPDLCQFAWRFREKNFPVEGMCWVFCMLMNVKAEEEYAKCVPFVYETITNALNAENNERVVRVVPAVRRK